MSDKDIDNLADELFKHSGVLMKAAEKGIECWQLIVGIIEMQEIQEEALYRLLNALPENSSFADALIMLLEDMDKSIVQHVIEHYCTEKALGLISDAIMNAISSAAGVALPWAAAKQILNFIADNIYQGAMADDIVRTAYLSTYVTELGIAVDNYKIEFMKAGSVKATAISEYEFLYSAYIVAIRTTLESALKMAKTEEEKSLVQLAVSVCNSYTYDKYIRFCMNELKADIDAGEVEAPTNTSGGSNSSSTTAANTVSQNKVLDRINSLKSIFPTGSCFSANGKPCDSSCLRNGLSYACQNCYLGNIIKQNATAKNALGSSSGLSLSRYSCCAFAGYAFYYIFGHDPTSNSHTILSDDYGGINDAFLSQLRPGDYLRLNDGKHFAIFLGYDSKNIYLYHANSTGPCEVQYNAARSWSKYSKIKAYRSKSYDVVETGTATVTHGYSGSTDEITENNAVVYATVTKPTSAKTERFGIRIRRTANTYENGWSYFHASSSNYSGKTTIKIWFDIQKEVGITLTHATSYTYQLYAKIDGKEYWSEEKTIVTKGSHSYGAWTTTKEATCTVAGSKQRKCACGDTETAAINALGHSYSTRWTVDTEATCTQAGSKSHHCTACSAKTDVTPIAATGHTYGSWTTTKEATCTVAGSKQRKCACGDIETAAINALGHSYSTRWTVDTEATCTQAGSKSHHCTACSAKTDVTPIAATGHSYGAWETAQEASCTADGRLERTCACAAVEYKAITALGHNWSAWTVAKEATTEHAGEEVRTCDRCSAQDTKEIPKLSADGHEHSFADTWTEVAPATCTQDGKKVRYCTVCSTGDYQVIPVLPHTFSEWKTVLEPTVEKEGTAVRNCVSCTYTEELSLPKLNVPNTTPSTDPTETTGSTEVPSTEAPVQQDSSADKMDVMIALTAVSILFSVGSVSALVVTAVKKKR